MAPIEQACSAWKAQATNVMRILSSIAPLSPVGLQRTQQSQSSIILFTAAFQYLSCSTARTDHIVCTRTQSSTTVEIENMKACTGDDAAENKAPDIIGFAVCNNLQVLDVQSVCCTAVRMVTYVSTSTLSGWRKLRSMPSFRILGHQVRK